MRFFLGFVFFSLSLPAGGQTTHPYLYLVLGYPRGAESCLQTAVDMGEALRRATGVPIQSAHCDKDAGTEYDLRIVYESAAELPLVSTEEKTGYAGTYPTRARCEEDLAAQTDLFERLTGLKSFLAYCYVDESGLAKSIGIRIDAFGKPAQWPHVFQDYATAPPLSPRKLEKDLRAALENAKLVPAVVAVLPSSETAGWYRIVLKYYGPQSDNWLLNRDEFFYDSPRDCEEQLLSTQSLLAAQKIPPAVAFCSWDGFLLRASVNFVSPWDAPWYKAEVTDRVFASLFACLKEKENVLAHSKLVLKSAAFGAVCARDRAPSFVPGARPHRVELLSPCPKFGAAECHHPLFR